MLFFSSEARLPFNGLERFIGRRDSDEQRARGKREKDPFQICTDSSSLGHWGAAGPSASTAHLRRRQLHSARLFAE